ncbi:hypothetical protein [Rhodopirellula sp. P2]|nr:hypothetical protein [Rhodopirellula sp. P2]WDQ17024.1 hypothetical protein PSR62_00375 [Rhodopirellula sp. P2]
MLSIPALQSGKVGFLEEDLNVASRENLGRDYRLWRRTDDQRYPCE